MTSSPTRSSSSPTILFNISKMCKIPNYISDSMLQNLKFFINYILSLKVREYQEVGDLFTLENLTIAWGWLIESNLSNQSAYLNYLCGVYCVLAHESSRGVCHNSSRHLFLSPSLCFSLTAPTPFILLSCVFTSATQEKLMLLSRGKSPSSFFPRPLPLPRASFPRGRASSARLVHYPARRVFCFCTPWK